MQFFLFHILDWILVIQMHCNNNIKTKNKRRMVQTSNVTAFYDSIVHSLFKILVIQILKSKPTKISI
jgi:hypothetical protein